MEYKQGKIEYSDLVKMEYDDQECKPAKMEYNDPVRMEYNFPVRMENKPMMMIMMEKYRWGEMKIIQFMIMVMK